MPNVPDRAEKEAPLKPIDSQAGLIAVAHLQVLRAVGTLQLRTCREIGREIVEFAQKGADRVGVWHPNYSDNGINA